MRDYFFIADGGELFDTREANWSTKPLRANYRRHHRDINSVADLKACLRAGRFTDLGGYPLYFLTDDMNALSFESVRDNFRTIADSIATDLRDGWKVIACEINYEDGDLYCAHSDKRIPSAYAEDGESE